ncbi:complement C1q tumor necrosis factor-related protein 6-like [Saccostrea echinata]|uniref:complement C1q tumor necrosis factor-related protein 6-like n=1 Tax=Saccostrea echinata TaxID=191078 RepID=UPI002A7FB3D5|nr:complement C1q tumor necrosis factor-related protein 6-like [Saccostrea echinata]
MNFASLVVLTAARRITALIRSDQSDIFGICDRRSMRVVDSSAKLPQHGIGFTACLSSSSGVNIGYLQTIEFDNVITNDGNGFDSRHGVFRAPVSGLYHFSMTISSTKSHPMVIHMVKDGNELIHSYLGDSDYLSSTQDVNVRLNAGQDVWCRNSQNYNALINAANYSCFSGHLISV